jgi:hypothetical protein
MKQWKRNSTVMKDKTRTRKHEAAQAGNLADQNEVNPLPEPKLHAPTPEQIRQRAYEIHKARGGAPGRELDDWLQAEREFMAEQDRPADHGGRTIGGGSQNTG